MLGALDELIERRIREAAQRGEFDDLPGAGRPLPLEDDALVPEELRVAYRILRNAGMLPPELDAVRHEDALLERALDAGGDAGCDALDALRRQRRVRALAHALSARGRDSPALTEYRHRIIDRIAGAPRLSERSDSTTSAKEPQR